MTYQELDEETTRVARIMVSSSGGNLQRGDRAVLVYPPSLDFMIAFLACLKAGVIAVPVFPPNPTRRDTLLMFSKIVDGAGAKVALSNGEYNYMKKMAGITQVFGKLKNKGAAAWPDNLKWVVTDTTSKVSTADSFQIVNPDPSDIAFLQYTSGSTSDPKGVMITHANLGHNLSIITNELKATNDTIVVSWGLIGSYLGALYCGGQGYYMSPLSFIQRPMLWIEAISKYKATHLQAPNFAFKLTARKFDKGEYRDLDLSSVRHIINAAEPVDEDSIESFYTAFCPFGLNKVIYPTYGLAESTVFVCSGGTQRLTVVKTELEVNGRVEIVSDPEKKDKEGLSRLIGCGFPDRQGVDVEIVDPESLVRLDEGIVGEIWVNSASKAAGYYGLSEESRRDFHAKIQGDNETDYLKTGDLGFMFNAELFICGRLKDLIIVGGRNYYPQDLEATAEGSSDLLRPGCSAAFTVDPTHQGGEEVALVMELKEVPNSSDAVERTCKPLADAVHAAVTQEHSLSLSEIVFLKTRTVPKTSSGKIARSWCRKGFINGTLSIVYRKSFRGSANSGSLDPMGVESGKPGGSQSNSNVNNVKASPAEIRALSKEEIYQRLLNDIVKVADIDRNAIQPTTPLTSMLDSLTISQFKGLYESHYAVKISDEYLFRESTTLNKLVEVAKLGHAPDDEGAEALPPGPDPNRGEGCAQRVFGCPPGVACVIL
eukprot:scaffold703_cov168-Amphora_coffeaeformis.AAC.24